MKTTDYKFIPDKITITDNKTESEEINCLHQTCIECNGTGRKISTGGMCVHMISCSCKKCSPFSL